MIVTITGVKLDAVLHSKAGKDFPAVEITSVKVDDKSEKRTILLHSVLKTKPALAAKVKALTAGKTVNLKFVKSGEYWNLEDILEPGEAPKASYSTGSSYKSKEFKLTDGNARYMAMHLTILESGKLDISRAKEIFSFIQEGFDGEVKKGTSDSTGFTSISGTKVSGSDYRSTGDKGRVSDPIDLAADVSTGSADIVDSPF